MGGMKLDGLEWLRKQLDGDDDMMQELLRELAERLIGAEVDARCGGEYGERSP